MSWKKFYQKYEKEIILLGTALFYVIPFFLLDYRNNVKTYSLALFLDKFIPFLPIFVLFYITMYIFVMLPYFLIKEKKYFKRVALAYVGILIISFFFYLFFPVKVDRPLTMGTNFWEEIVRWIRSIDPGYNCFPSLHVATPLLTSLSCFHYNQKYWWPLPWAFLIIISTVLIKQHYILDVLAGILVGLMGYWWLVKYEKRA